MQIKRFRAMGCDIAAFLDAESRLARLALKRVPLWFESWEQSFSRFRPESELSRLNASPETLFAVSDGLWEVLGCAVEAARWTGGLVTPAVLPLVEEAGYDRSLERVQARSTGAPCNPSARPGLLEVSRESWREIELDEAARAVRLPVGIRLDLGGIAKGWCAFQAMRRLQECGPALVDAGGDLAVSGLQRSGQPWPVAVDDPLQVQDSLAVLALPECGVATSGVNRRRWMQDGVWKHHIIDPRSGQPADTDLESVTVVAADAILAEAAAKKVLISGSKAGTGWLEQQPGLGACLALADGATHYAGEIGRYIWDESLDGRI